jgi:hypothetical protein
MRAVPLFDLLSSSFWAQYCMISRKRGGPAIMKMQTYIGVREENLYNLLMKDESGYNLCNLFSCVSKIRCVDQCQS